MKNLAHHDYQKILGAVEILNFDVEPQGLPQRMVAAVNYAVAGDITAFEMVSQTGEYQGCLIYEPLEAISAGELETYNHYINEHPFCEAILLNRRFDAIKVSDFMNDGQFMRTGIYNEYYRRISINRQISVTMNIDQDCLIFCTMSRNHRDFDETERAVLNLMAPHLTTAIRHAKFFEQAAASEQTWRSVAESLGRAVIVFNAQTGIEYLSERAEQLLEKYFPDEKSKIYNLPVLLHDWVMQNVEDCRRTRDFYLPPKPLMVAAESQKLVVRFSFNTATNSVNLLLNEEKELTPQDLSKFGLTGREAEILYWMATGKTNSEIAALCSLSVRTVHKHLEHIYTKLGVENRTAAILRACETIR